MSDLIKKSAYPDDLGAPGDKRQRRINWFMKIIYSIRGQAFDDVNRLKEAGVKIVEAEAAHKMATARKVEAEAHAIYVEAEIKRERFLQEPVAKKPVEVDSVEFNETDDTNKEEEAMQRLLAAARAIKSMGGQVMFDSAQISEELDKLLDDEQS